MGLQSGDEKRATRLDDIEDVRKNTTHDDTNEEPQETGRNNAGYGDVQVTFDTGFTAWLQVLGGFFLTMNASYVACT